MRALSLMGAAATFVVASLLAACSTGGSDGGSEATTSPGTGSTAPATGSTSPGSETQAGGTTEETAEPPAGPTLRVDLGPDVRTLDPAEATDPAEGSVLLALLDPLVRLAPDGTVVPGFARRWDVSADGRVVTFHLRQDGVWTNGDPVTAEDYEYAWKRAAAPRFASTNAPLFADIVGAQAYTECDAEEQDCPKLQSRIGVVALDDITLEVTLIRSMPWFPARVAHWAFVPVHEPTIAEFKRRWALPENIVSNGPFHLLDWTRRSSITLERWEEWRDAGTVDLARIEGSMQSDQSAALASFEQGQVDACLPGQCIPDADLDRLAGVPEFSAYPAPVTTYLGVNTARVPDPRQRQAIAIGLDRRAIVVKAVAGEATPATLLAAAGLPGVDPLSQSYLEDRARRAKARRMLKRADRVRAKLVLAYTAEDRALADLLALQLSKIGLEATLEEREAGDFDGADLYIARARAEDADAIEILERWTCGSEETAARFCDRAYDRLIREARQTVADEKRYSVEAEAESLLTGSKGAFPAVPLYWETFNILQGDTVEGFDPNLLEVVDFTTTTLPEQ